MSEENGKVCCSCRHCIRVKKEEYHVECLCDIDGKWLSYLDVMSFWCRRWAKDRSWEEEA